MRAKLVVVALCVSMGLLLAVAPMAAAQEDGPYLDYDDPCAYADPYLWGDACGEGQSDGSVVHSGCNACVACAGVSTCCIAANVIASRGT